MENVEQFASSFSDSLREDTFVKMTLGNYKGDDKHLQKLLVRLIKTKKGVRLFFLYKYDTRDTAKNYSFQEGTNLIKRFLGSDFFAGHLFTTESNFQLDIGKKGRSRLNVGKPTFRDKPDLSHDRKKAHLIDPKSFYLMALGITNDRGDVRAKQQDKWKQINKFVETLGSLFDQSQLKNRDAIDIVDMGSGKGYLTFATYDFFKNKRGIDVRVTGVDTKSELIELCDDIAKTSEFHGLKFRCGRIDDFEFQKTDILIALHACNTATDDAIFKGIKAHANLIVVAPCCHQEIRPQIQSPDIVSGLLKHGVLLEREAESVTDGLRALSLERCGYASKIFEFVSTEHTPKNNMIVGTLQTNPHNSDKITKNIEKIKEFYGIESQRLDELIKLEKKAS